MATRWQRVEAILVALKLTPRGVCGVIRERVWTLFWLLDLIQGLPLPSRSRLSSQQLALRPKQLLVARVVNKRQFQLD